ATCRSLRFNFHGLVAKANSVDCRRGASRCVKPTRRHRHGVEVLRVRRDISGTHNREHPRRKGNNSDRRVLASPRQSPRKEDGTLRPGIDRCVSHTSICFFGNRRDNYPACLTCAISGSVISGAGRFWGRGGLSGARIQNRPTFMGFLPVSNPTSFSLTSLGFSSHQRWAGVSAFVVADRNDFTTTKVLRKFVLVYLLGRRCWASIGHCKGPTQDLRLRRSYVSVSERVAIAGVTGYIGGRLAPRLLEHGYAIRCLVRSPAKLQNRSWVTDPNVQIRRAELADETSLTRDLEGCEAAFYLVHSMMSAGSGYAEHDRQLASTFARASKNAGVKRIIYLGGLGETGPDLSEHLSSRREVEEALASSGVPVTVLRAAMIIGSGSASFEILRYLVERLPVMVTPKWVSTPCQPIAVRNVIGYLVGVLAVPETAGGVFDIGGPDVFCYRDIMRIMAEELGLRRRLIIPVPVLTPRLSSYWIQLITP